MYYVALPAPPIALSPGKNSSPVTMDYFSCPRYLFKLNLRGFIPFFLVWLCSFMTLIFRFAHFVAYISSSCFYC